MVRVLFYLLSVFILLGCQPDPIYTVQSSTCHPNQLCNYSGGIAVALDKPDVQPETPFDLLLTLPEGWRVKNAKMTGIDMYMGMIPVFFEKNEHQWHAQTMVGACSSPDMMWQLSITLYQQTDSPETQLKEILYFIKVLNQ